MSTTQATFNYAAFLELLNSQQVAMTPAEVHGLVTGLLIGEKEEQKRIALIYDLTNEGIAFSNELRIAVLALSEYSHKALESDEFAFELLLPQTDIIFDKVDALGEWVNLFLLGLGITQPNIHKMDDESTEIFNDLRHIAQLGYDEDDDLNSVERDLEEVLEYVKMSAIYFYDLFNQKTKPSEQIHKGNTTIH